MRKLHIGDIIENLHALETNPHRKGIVKDLSRDYVYMMTIYKGKIDKYSFYRYDVERDEDGFIIKGNVKLNVIIKNILDKY